MRPCFHGWLSREKCIKIVNVANKDFNQASCTRLPLTDSVCGLLLLTKAVVLYNWAYSEFGNLNFKVLKLNK